MPADYFLKLEGINGESRAAGHRGEIDVMAWSWGELQAGGGGGGAGGLDLESLRFRMRPNRASPRLMLACATGQHIPEATLTVRQDSRNAGSDYLQIRLEDVLVSSYQPSAAGSRLPVESLSLSYTKVELTYRLVRRNGTLGPPITAEVEGERSTLASGEPVSGAEADTDAA